MTVFQLHTASCVINWTGKKILGLHTGTIQVQKGTIAFEQDQLNAATIEIDMRSILVTDMEEEKSRNEFSGHLKHVDFFDVANHPIADWKFVIAEEMGNNQYKLEGILTIKDISHPVEFIASIERFTDMVHVLGEIHVDRTRYNIRYGSGKYFNELGDKLIHDKFVLQFKLIGNKVNATIYEKLESN
ncbi:YceI family protein [Flavihumibacter sp. UBA7668]|uniref:YceI family protein n=1 Tax=Flavihumibacter sp. UBA7668 TaxID=1946542 RepID=UPI0025BB2E84|nr:YceI family protein [Flavihumibacter sp. UBA7668]